VVVMRTREGRGGSSVSPIERNRRRAQYEPIIREAANFYHLPPALLHAVIEVESGYHPEAVSPAGAMGLMQLMPSTAERMGVLDPFDPRQNIFGGARYLRVLANTFNGDLVLTLAAYHAGEAAVVRFGGVPPFPDTQRYVERVLELYRQYLSGQRL
ncbi:MAG: lytic transglycosylase domain-containing protein, partial [Deltaproteobacteria bacterium]|nr:lytic transglycosylase domain-containing protein [Deltaproteobacteria bacterium]